MEGAPRIPMYSFQIKTSSLPIEIDVLKTYLETEYGESANAYDTEFKALLDLRKSALESPHDLGGLSLLKKYYGQLQLLKSRFPMEECETCALPVSWDDLYIDDVVTHSDIRFEEAAVLYNIGSLESILGCKQARTDADGIKAACTHFMSAAWCFQRVSEVFSGAVAPDLESELMRLKAQMMLAQAQECVFRKSQLDGRKSGINARIAQQLVDYYGQLGSMMSSAGTVAKVIPSRTRKHYAGIFSVKSSFYESQVAYYSAQTAEDTAEYGLRLAWLTKAREALQAALAGNKELKDAEMRETLAFVQDVIVAKHESAEKDNNLIYHAQVPQSVPEVQAALLVKPLPFDPTESAGPDLFKRLVPLKTSEASSVYSEEVSKKLREIGDAAEAKDTEVAECLSSLQADPEFYLVSEDSPLPQALFDACAQLSVEGDAAQKRLTQRMQQLASAAVDVDSLLAELRQLTADPPADVAASIRPFLQDLAKCERVAREAQPSNESLRASASRHAEGLAELRKSPEELRASLPTVTDLQSDQQLHQSVAELRRLLAKVAEMRAQRADLLSAIRADLRSEDATSLLLRQPNQDPVQLFQASLAKQQDRFTYLNQNMAAQANILSALIDIHAKLVPQRELIARRRAEREAAVQRLVSAWAEGSALLDKVQEGVDFFTGLLRKLKVIEARLKPLLARPKPPPTPPTPPQNRLPQHQQQQQQPQSMHQYPQMPQLQNHQQPDNPSSSFEPMTLPPAGLLSSFSGAPSSASSSDPPRLKDFLPFMKPGTYGAQSKSQRSQAMSSLPASPQRPVPSAAGQPQQQQQPYQPLTQFREQQQYGRHSPLPTTSAVEPQHQQFRSHSPSSMGQFGSQFATTSETGASHYFSNSQQQQQPSLAAGGGMTQQMPHFPQQTGNSVGGFPQHFGSVNGGISQQPAAPVGFHQQPVTSAAGFHQQPVTSAVGFHQQPVTSAVGFHQQPVTSAAGFHQQPQSSSSGFPQQPPSSSLGFPQQPRSSSAGFPQQPISSSAGFPQQPQSSSAGFPQQPLSSSSGFPQQPPSSSSGFPLQPPSSSAGFPQQPPSSSAGFPQQPQSSSSGFPQQPPSSSSGFPQQPPSSSAGFPQQPQSSSSGFPQQPQSSSSGFPQQPPSSSAGFPQQPQSSSSGFPQQPPSSSAGFPQQPTSSSAGFPQQPPSSCAGFPQQPPSSCAGFPQQQIISNSGFPQQSASMTAGHSQQLAVSMMGFSQQQGATPGFPQFPESSLGRFSGVSQQQANSSAGFPQRQQLSSWGFSQLPETSTGAFSQPMQTVFAANASPQQPSVSGLRFPQQPGTSSAGLPGNSSGSQQPAPEKSSYPQQPGPSVGAFPQQQSVSTGGFPQQPSVSTWGFPQQPAASIGGFPQQPSVSTAGFPQQQSISNGEFRQQASVSTGGFPPQPSVSTGGFPQQPSVSTAGFPQKPSVSTGAFPQQQSVSTGGFSQQPGNFVNNYPQQPAGFSSVPNQFVQPQQPPLVEPLKPQQQQQQQQQPCSLPAVRPTGFAQQPVLNTEAAKPSSGASTPQQQQQQQQHQQQQVSSDSQQATKNNSSNGSRSLLDSVADDSAAAAAAVLKPSVLTSAERELQVAEAQLRKQSGVDRLSDNLLFNQLIADTERLGRRLPVPDAWQLHQAALKALLGGHQRRPATVAMCHPMQNRSPECVPYDSNRVIVGDDSAYLNASLVHWQSTRLILAQQPTKSQLASFYRMLVQYGCELMCQLGPSVPGLAPYWPDAKGESANYGPVEVTVRALHPGEADCTERVIAVRVGDASRTLVMLQVHSDYPAAVERACQVLSDQRSPLRPVCLVCPDGSTKCGLFGALLAARHQLKLDGKMPPLVDIAASLASQRPCVLSDPQQLQHLYANFHEICQILLRKKGVLVRQSSTAAAASAAVAAAAAAAAAKSTSRVASSERSSPTQGTSCEPSKPEAAGGASSNGSPAKDFLQSLDAKNIRIEPVPEDKRRIRREDFNSGRESRLKPEQVPNDPFSSLDPLWSHHKQ